MRCRGRAPQSERRPARTGSRPSCRRINGSRRRPAPKDTRVCSVKGLTSHSISCLGLPKCKLFRKRTEANCAVAISRHFGGKVRRLKNPSHFFAKDRISRGLTHHYGGIQRPNVPVHILDLNYAHCFAPTEILRAGVVPYAVAWHSARPVLGLRSHCESHFGLTRRERNHFCLFSGVFSFHPSRSEIKHPACRSLTRL